MAKVKKSNKYADYAGHFPNSISDKIKDFVDNYVLMFSRYIFIRTMKGIQFGYCTHCKNRYVTPEKLKHNEETRCAKCNSRCMVKNHGTSRKYLYDSAFIVYYEKSVINSQAIVARAFRVSRNYSGDYAQVETSFTATAKYLFEPGNALMFENYWWNEKDKWVSCATVHSVESKSIYANNETSNDSIREAIKGTPFQYSQWDEYDHPQEDCVKFFALFSKYPCIEYLAKLGFKDFVEAKLFDRLTYGCINWSGGNIEKILKMSKSDLKALMAYPGEISRFQLFLYQMSRKDKDRPSIDEIVEWSKDKECFSTELKVILRHANLRRIINYIQKQLNRMEAKKYKTQRSVITAWRDYLNECKKLDYDLTNDRIIYPSNLYASHQKTMKLVIHVQNKLTDLQIIKRVDKLKEYSFEDDNFLLRPAESCSELIYEGKVLSICVGGYANNYAKGKTSIFLIREKSDPEHPFYTMEYKSGQITQVQGFEHKSPTKEVQKFIDQFKALKLKNKIKDTEAAV